MFKKFYSIIFIMSLLCVKLSADPPVYLSEFQVALTKDGKGCIITKCIDERIGGVSNVPEEIEGLPVKEIGKEAFKNIKVSYIYLPSTLEKIGDSAFWGCENLQSIDIPDSVTSIGRFAFCCTSSLKNVKFPLGKVKIYNVAFAKSGLRNLTIKGNMIFVDDGAGWHIEDRDGYHFAFFYGCDNLETLTIEADVEEIPSSFLTSKTLKTVVFKSAETIVDENSFSENFNAKYVNCPNLSLASQAAIKQHIKENNTAYQAKIKAKQDAERPKIEKAIVEYIDKNGFCEKSNILRNIDYRFNSVKEEVFATMLSSGKLIEEERGYYITPQKRKLLLAEAEKKIEEMVKKDELLYINNLKYNKPLGDNLEFVREEAFANVLKAGKICEVQIGVENRGVIENVTYLAIPGTYPSLLEKAEKNILAYVQSCEKCEGNSIYKNSDNATRILMDTALVNLLNSNKIIKYDDKSSRNSYYATPEKYAENLAKEKAEQEKRLTDAENAVVEYVREHGPCSQDGWFGFYYERIEIEGHSYYIKDIALENAVKSGRLVKYNESSRDPYYATPEKYAENLAKEKAEKEKLLADVENAIVEYVREHGPCQCNSQIDDIGIGYDYATIEIDGHSYYVKKVALENVIKSGRLVEYKKNSSRGSSGPYYATPEKLAELKNSAEGKNIIDKNDELMAEAEMAIYAFITRNINKFKKEEILERINPKYDSVKEKAFTNLEEKGKIGANEKGVYRYWLQ